MNVMKLCAILGAILTHLLCWTIVSLPLCLFAGIYGYKEYQDRKKALSSDYETQMKYIESNKGIKANGFNITREALKSEMTKRGKSYNLYLSPEGVLALQKAGYKFSL